MHRRGSIRPGRWIPRREGPKRGTRGTRRERRCGEQREHRGNQECIDRALGSHRQMRTRRPESRQADSRANTTISTFVLNLGRRCASRPLAPRARSGDRVRRAATCRSRSREAATVARRPPHPWLRSLLQLSQRRRACRRDHGADRQAPRGAGRWRAVAAHLRCLSAPRGRQGPHGLPAASGRASPPVLW